LAIGWLGACQRASETLGAASAEAAGLRAALAAERVAAQQREAMLVRTDAQLRELFGVQAAEALRRNGDEVADRAAMSLAPLRDSLERVQQQLTELERGRASSDTALREQVRTMTESSQQLRTQTSALTTALRAPHVRGRWGEMQLERVVEAAGLTEHVHYATQVTATTADGAVRPDLVVSLPGGKNVVVDSKVAFSAYLEATEATDERVSEERLCAHAKQLRAHVDALAAKSYWQQFSPSPDFVICFVPADAFLDAALRKDPSLLEHAFAHDVVLATPSTLVALLRTIAYTWRQEALATNADALHELGRDLYHRLATLGDHVGKLGKSLGAAVGAYNDTVGSLERRVFASARRMTDLGVLPAGATLTPLRPLTDSTPRLLSAVELTDQRVVSLPRRVGSEGEASSATSD
jgi:DNA recombination protein RmuC